MSKNVRMQPLIAARSSQPGSVLPSQYSSPTQYASSVSFSTSTPDHGDPGRGWNYRQVAFSPSPPQPSRLAKIKSSPSHGALEAARQAASHAKLHKRADSASAAQTSPDLPLSATAPHLSSGFTYTHPASPEMAQTDPYAVGSAPSRTKTKIKPLLRKLTGPEDNSLDLSRSAADNEGLGIYASDYGSSQWTPTDGAFASSGKRGPTHNRSTSGASQFSTATTASGSRQYVHPMRQTPRPYTPPIAQSYQNSVLGSEYSADGAGVGSDEEERIRQIVRDASCRVANSQSPSSQAMPLQIQTNVSSAKLLDTSQTNLSGTTSSARRRADTMSPTDPASPKSRSSLERNFMKRSRTMSDPASRAESIRAARQAFTEKEAAKAQKAEKEEMRALERQNRKLEKLRESQREKSSNKGKSPNQSAGQNEKIDGVAGREYSTLTPGQSVSGLGGDGGAHTQGRPGMNRRRSEGANTATSTAHGRWVAFVVWLKTRLFKLGRKMSGGW